MGYLHCLLILLLARVFLIAESSFADYKEALFDIDSVIPSHGIATCNGRVGDCIDEAEEMMLDSEASRRVLAQTRYISYDALRRGNIPCSRRGSSYYNCGSHQKINPYSGGCTRITNCVRNTR